MGFFYLSLSNSYFNYTKNLSKGHYLIAGNTRRVLLYNSFFERKLEIHLYSRPQNIYEIEDKNDNKGIIRLTAKFNENFNQKIDFDIPLSYPILSIKCTNPKANANIEFTIDCKVQKEFSNVDRLIIEPTIIKKKNKEFFIVSKTNLPLTYKNCADYNQKQIENSQQKYNADYTFLQVNSFTLNQGKILFNLIIYHVLSSYYAPTIQLSYTLRKKSK